MKNAFAASIVALCALLAGCVADGNVSKVRKEDYKPEVLEREGLALARIVTSPYSMVGFTYADLKRCGNKAPIVFPFDLLRTIPAGALAACADIVTGTAELVSFQQIKSVSYPWESFDKEKADKWGDPILEIYLAALAGAAEGLAEAGKGGGTSYSQASGGNRGGGGETSATSKTKPRIRHSSCGGTGRCNVCHGKGYAGNDPKNSRLRCRSCGGGGRCGACHGSGWAN